MDSNKSLLELADEYAAASSNMTAADIFKKKDPVEDKKMDVSKEEEKVKEENIAPISLEEKLNSAKKELKSSEKKPWTPSSDLMDDLPEMKTTGVVYDKKDVVLNRDGKLVNIMDDKTIESGTSKVQELVRINQNIELAKQRRNIKYFHIPEGPFQMKMTLAAADPNVKDAQKALDEIIDEIEKSYPDMIEYNKEETTKVEENKNEPESIDDIEVEESTDKEVVETINKVSNDEEEDEEEESLDDVDVSDDIEISNKHESIPVTLNVTEVNERKTNIELEETYNDIDELNIDVDKASLANMTWTPEEIEKVRRSRVVNLNIIEKDDIEFGSIKNADDKMVDLVTQSYYRKNNDIEAVLPASHYRATFSGLTYTEVLDLRTSQEINPVDSEKLKWSICFKHIHNQSIGPWEEYVIYRDPTTQEEYKVPTIRDVPKKIPRKNIHTVTTEEDFLRKTSYADLEFILWKILCATSMPEEIIQFTCSNKVNGVSCNNVYDWIYQPSSLLDESTIEPAVLEEMAKTGKAMSKEEILANYNDSLLNAQNYVRLPSSKFVVLYGHASAYEYINDIYPLIRSLSDKENINNPLSISKMLRYLALACIRELLIPNKENNGYIRIKNANNIIKVLDTFNEFDWQTINQIASMIINPYNFRYVMKNIVCPKCGHKEDVEIDTIVRLLFIVAQSLENVQVTLSKK